MLCGMMCFVMANKLCDIINDGVAGIIDASRTCFVRRCLYLLQLQTKSRAGEHEATKTDQIRKSKRQVGDQFTEGTLHGDGDNH